MEDSPSQPAAILYPLPDIPLPMWHLLSQRLLTLLQLTRMALVFTAIADGLCTVMLSAQQVARQVLASAGISVGLYGFGMSLNDIIDRRRDSQISPHRPLPSGRV